jgi:ribonuclease Z
MTDATTIDRIVGIPLGTSSAVPAYGRHLSSFAFSIDGRVVLFDCGEGTQFQILRAPMSLWSIDVIAISHLHGDHVYGLPGLLASLGMNGRTRELVIIGPPELRAMIRGVMEPSDLRLPFRLEIIDARNGDVYDSPAYRIVAQKLDHRITAFGYRIEEHDRPGRFDLERARQFGVPEGPLFRQLQRGRHVVLPGGAVVHSQDVTGPRRRGRVVVHALDTLPSRRTVELAAEADLLVHEATFGDELASEARERSHSTSRDAATVARDAGVRRLLLTHFSGRYEDPLVLLPAAREVFPETDIARELIPVEVEKRDDPVV